MQGILEDMKTLSVQRTELVFLLVKRFQLFFFANYVAGTQGEDYTKFESFAPAYSRCESGIIESFARAYI